MDWREFIDCYDRSHAFFYVNPPYRYKSAKKYYKYFEDTYYKDLNKVLNRIKGRFMLSLKGDEFILKTYKGFKIEEVQTKYSINKADTKSVIEL